MFDKWVILLLDCLKLNIDDAVHELDFSTILLARDSSGQVKLSAYMSVNITTSPLMIEMYATK